MVIISLKNVRTDLVLGWVLHHVFFLLRAFISLRILKQVHGQNNEKINACLLFIWNNIMICIIPEYGSVMHWCLFMLNIFLLLFFLCLLLVKSSSSCPYMYIILTGLDLLWNWLYSCESRSLCNRSGLLLSSVSATYICAFTMFSALWYIQCMLICHTAFHYIAIAAFCYNCCMLYLKRKKHKHLKFSFKLKVT